MGSSYSTWLHAQGASLTPAEQNLERRLHRLLLFEQRRQDEVKKQALAERQRAKRRAVAPQVPHDCKIEAPPPLPSEVVSDESIAVLQAACAAKEVTIKAYIERALAAEPVVDMMDATVCGVRHRLPRVSLPEAMTVQEFKAIEKQYVSARHLPSKKALILRTKKVLEQVEQRSGTKNSDYAVVDATGFLSGIFVRKAYSAAGRRGRRALLALNFMKGMQGYMKCCAGSGALTGYDERNSIKYKERLVAYGISKDKHPTELAISGSLEKPQNGSAQLHYMDKDGRCHSFQAGAWLARRELPIEEVRHELGAFGLEAHVSDVAVFLSESKDVLRKYGALLLVGGQDEVPEDKIDSELDAELLWKILSMVVIDSGNKSRFGAHTDTPQIAPCLCTAESVYAPGFYDYEGGEMCFFNGMYADDYGPEGCLLLSGHRAVHAPLPLRPPGDRPGMPMMRFSLVAWSHAGDAYPGTRDELEMYRHQYGYPDTDPRMQQLEAALDVIARVTVGAGRGMEQLQGRGVVRRGRSASALDGHCMVRPSEPPQQQQHSELQPQHSELQQQQQQHSELQPHTGFGPGACVDARWPGDPCGWHGGHIVQSFANGTYEVAFDDGDRSRTVRMVRARDQSLSPCAKCAALWLQGAVVDRSMCAPSQATTASEGGAAAESTQTRAHQIVGDLGMQLRRQLQLRGGGGKCRKKSAA